MQPQQREGTSIPSPRPPQVVGRAAAAAFVADPPDVSIEPAPVIVCLADPASVDGARGLRQRLPLRRLRAWRVYVDLPGGVAADDRSVTAAVESFPAFWESVRGQLGIREHRLALLGIAGSTVVTQAVMIGGEVQVSAAVLVSPVIALPDTVVEADPEHLPYDFIAAADQFGAGGIDPEILMVVGEQDDFEAIRGPAGALRDTIDAARPDQWSVELRVVPGPGRELGAPGNVPGRADEVITTFLQDRFVSPDMAAPR